MTKLTSKVSVALLLLAGINLNARGQSKSEYTQIIARFEQWKDLQYKRGTYEIDKRCNRDTVSREGYKGSGMGIPKDIKISFTDINADNKLDAIISFNPDQCDGGNALMNVQIRVLILSKGATYIADDTFFDKIETQFKNGWLNIESASYGTFFGNYNQYKDSDGRCCPSIKRPIEIDYKTKKLTFLDKE